MTPDPKDKMFAAGRTPTEADILKALGTGVSVVTVDGTVALPSAGSMTLETLVVQLNRVKRSRVLRAQVDPRHLPATPPITGGHHNGQRRNAPCHCGSGRKWKKCCGAPAEGERVKLVAVPPQKGM